MPSLQASAVELNPERYTPATVPTQAQAPHNAPLMPDHLLQSSIMVSSLPAIATSVDGITRQFYGSGRFPTRRLILPA